MSAQYPANVRSFTSKKDFIDTVDAADPNTLQDEVQAIESTLGVNPHVSTAANSSGTFNATSVTYGSVGARLANIETGIVGDSHTQYVHIKGGDSITPATASTVGLIYRAIAGQTSHQIEFRDTSNAVVGWIAPNADASFNVVTAMSLNAAMIIGMGTPVPFHLSGIVTTGLKIPKFIPNMNMTILGVWCILDSGSGVTITVRVNGTAIANVPTTAIGSTTAVYVDVPNTNVTVGDRIQIEVTNAGTSASDLSATLDIVTR